MKKSLRELLIEADGLIQSTQPSSIRKEASQTDAKVSAFTDFLLNADTLSSDEYFPAVEVDPEFEKIAVHLNFVHAAADIANEIKLNEFEKRATYEGYSQKEIAEVIDLADAADLYEAATQLVKSGAVKIKL